MYLSFYCTQLSAPQSTPESRESNTGLKDYQASNNPTPVNPQTTTQSSNTTTSNGGIIVHVPTQGQYLGYSREKCRTSIPVVGGSSSPSAPAPVIGRSPASTTPPISSPTSPTRNDAIVSNNPTPAPTSNTLYPTESPAREVVADLARWNPNVEGFQCPLATPQDGYYSSYYQCQAVVVKCNPNNVIETNLGWIKDIVTDGNSRGVYNSVKYPSYLGKNILDCENAIKHANALERSGLYK